MQLPTGTESEFEVLVTELVDAAARVGISLAKLAKLVGTLKGDIYKTTRGERRLHGGHLMRICDVVGASREVRERLAALYVEKVIKAHPHFADFIDAYIQAVHSESPTLGRDVALRAYRTMARANDWPLP